jgi:hypothetical protein
MQLHEADEDVDEAEVQRPTHHRPCELRQVYTLRVMSETFTKHRIQHLDINKRRVSVVVPMTGHAAEYSTQSGDKRGPTMLCITSGLKYPAIKRLHAVRTT